MITDLRRLWKQAFGDPDAFLDSFFATAYAPERCRYLTVEGQLGAALYWFDCQWAGKKLAYLYAVATDEAFRGQGLCRRLIAETHDHLRAQGYSGVLLVPGNDALFRLYEKLGYRTCGYVREFSRTAGAPVSLRPIDKGEYARLRRQYLPPCGVVQEGVTLDFLSEISQFYAGEACVLCASVEAGHAHIHELLGQADASGIVAALGADTGHFRTPGSDRPFAMYYGFTPAPPPAYLGIALD